MNKGWAGKIIGMLIGGSLAGSFGLIVGFIIGHFVLDKGWLQLGVNNSSYPHPSKLQEIFFNTTFRVMGHVAKSDGRVSEASIRQARYVMQQMGLNEDMKHEAINLFTEGKQPDFNLDNALDELKEACIFQPSLLRIFLEMQIQMAYADGRMISEAKRRILRYISQKLGMSGIRFDQFEQQYRAEQNYQRYQQHHSPATETSRLAEAYKILGVSSTASMLEIKKAYRQLMNQHHPDKLMAKGLPSEMIEMATQKTQQIKSAYEQIRKSKGEN